MPRRDIVDPALGQGLVLLAVKSHLELAAIDPAPGAIVSPEFAHGFVTGRHLDIAAIEIAVQQHLLLPTRLAFVRLQNIGYMPDRLVDLAIAFLLLLLCSPNKAKQAVFAGGRGPPVGLWRRPG